MSKLDDFSALCEAIAQLDCVLRNMGPDLALLSIQVGTEDFDRRHAACSQFSSALRRSVSFTYAHPRQFYFAYPVEMKICDVKVSVTSPPVLGPSFRRW